MTQALAVSKRKHRDGYSTHGDPAGVGCLAIDKRPNRQVGVFREMRSWIRDAPAAHSPGTAEPGLWRAFGRSSVRQHYPRKNPPAVGVFDSPSRIVAAGIKLRLVNLAGLGRLDSVVVPMVPCAGVGPFVDDDLGSLARRKVLAEHDHEPVVPPCAVGVDMFREVPAAADDHRMGSGGVKPQGVDCRSQQLVATLPGERNQVPAEHDFPAADDASRPPVVPRRSCEAPAIDAARKFPVVWHHSLLAKASSSSGRSRLAGLPAVCVPRRKAQAPRKRIPGRLAGWDGSRARLLTCNRQRKCRPPKSSGKGPAESRQGRQSAKYMGRPDYVLAEGPRLAVRAHLVSGWAPGAPLAQSPVSGDVRASLGMPEMSRDVGPKHDFSAAPGVLSRRKSQVSRPKTDF